MPPGSSHCNCFVTVNGIYSGSAVFTATTTGGACTGTNATCTVVVNATGTAQAFIKP